MAPPIGRYVDELRRDVQQAGGAYNPAVACYVDLTRPDNRYRFFVLDLAKRKVLLQGLCLNGVTDAQGRILDVNTQAYREMGYSLAELMAMTVADFALDLSRDALLALWQKMEPGEHTVATNTHRRKDGSCFPVEVGVWPALAPARASTAANANTGTW